MSKIIVKGVEINVMSVNSEDFISLTDMLKAKDGDFFISDWLRNRNTVEFLGIWEQIHNPVFNYGEFALIRSQIGLNSFKISVKEAFISQLICLANLETLNAHLIQQGITQSERLIILNKMAIQQMRILTNDPGVKRLEAKDD